MEVVNLYYSKHKFVFSVNFVAKVVKIVCLTASHETQNLVSTI